MEDKGMQTESIPGHLFIIHAISSIMCIYTFKTASMRV